MPAASPDRPAPDDFRAVVRDAARLNRVLAILDDHEPIAVVADRVVLALSELFAAEIVLVLSTGEGDALEPLALIGLPDEGRGAMFSCSPDGPGDRSLRTRVPVYVDDAVADPVLDMALGGLGVRSAILLPLAGAEEVRGLLVIARCRPPAFSHSDGDLLLAIAHRLAMAIERTDAAEERRRTEELRVRAEKLESLTRIAAAVAHHFNNKLTAVMGYLDLALDSLPPDAAATRDVRGARESAREASRVGQLLLDYLGADPEPHVPTDIATLVRGGLTAMIPRLPAAVVLRADVPAGPLLVVGAPGHLREILDHLLANAIEAMTASGGEVRVRVRAVDGPEGRRASLEVADTGCGMTQDAIRVAFEPFYTTKATGRGLGLAAVMGLAHAHGGVVTIESEPGRGSTVRVLLPLSAAPPAARS
jgi:signal transduction histidine kinase